MLFLVLFLIFFVYSPSFLFGTLASGDWPYLFKETIQSFSFAPDPHFLWLGPYYQWTSKLFVQYLGLPWEFTERIAWFWVFLLVSFVSSYCLSRFILGKSGLNFLSVLIFMTNTYILMIVGGGQMGVALSYAFAPAVLCSFFQIFNFYEIKENSKIKIPKSKIILFGFLLGLHIMFDPRVAYITGFSIVLYLLIYLICSDRRKAFKSIIYVTLISGITALIINSVWILPRMLAGTENFLSDPSSGTRGSLSFFSFGSFSQALSLLHPNWPENIFGKTYFLRPEFLLLPLLAFSALLFVKKETEIKKEIVFFGMLGLLGVFLSKGTQGPFGGVYEWMFVHIPGFFLFRDPTKFYILTALSYSILIPFSLENISKKVSGIKYYVLSISFLLFWCFLIKPALFGQLSGTFRVHGVPAEYIELKNFLVQSPSSFSTLWVPNTSPFSFYSKTKPSLDVSFLFGNATSSAIGPLFTNKKVNEKIKSEHIRYIIVPQDTEGKIFLNDRKYDEREYIKTVENLEKVSYLHKIDTFGKIVVFEVKQ